MSDETLPQSEIILYQTEDGRTRIQCRLENETIWLTQSQIAELFQTTPQNVTLHLKAIFAEGELLEAATCKDYLQVRLEGGRQVSRALRHYRLEAILAVGFRVRSQRGTQFRQWATARLGEYLVKGFTMDDERQNDRRRSEVCSITRPHKNKRPQQSPEPNVDRASPVLVGKHTKRYSNLPSFGYGCGGYLTGPARIFCEMPFMRRKRSERSELEAGATIRKFRIVRSEGSRDVTREIEHYNLDAILAGSVQVTHYSSPCNDRKR